MMATLKFFILAIFVFIAMVKVDKSDAINVPEALLSDPRFSSCMEETSGPEDSNYMAVFARCYSFAGRPRFGKRASNYRDIAGLFKHYRMLRDLYDQQGQPLQGY